MQSFDVFGFFGGLLVLVIFVACAYFYFKSAFQAFKNVRDSEYSALTVARVVGIFIIPLGVLLGFV